MQKPSPYTSEHEWLNAVSRKELPALSLLYDNYSPLLFHIIYDITGNTALSEELLQKTFFAIWQGSPLRPSHQRFLTWTICLARNFANESVELLNSQIHETINFVNEQKQVNFVSKIAGPVKDLGLI